MLAVLALLVGSTLLLSVGTGPRSDVLGASGIALVMGGRATRAVTEPKHAPRLQLTPPPGGRAGGIGVGGTC